MLAHPWVTGELALGDFSQHNVSLRLLAGLPSAEVATDAEVLGLIEPEGLYGLGIGYVDAHHLAERAANPANFERSTVEGG